MDEKKIIMVETIIAVLFIGFVFGYSTGTLLNDKSKRHEKQTSTGFNVVKPLDWSITTANNGDRLLLINGVGSRVVITDINLTGQGGEVCGGSADGTGVNSGLTIPIDPGDYTGINLTNSCSGTLGSPYKIKVTIGYNKTIGTITESYISTGTISGVFVMNRKSL